MHECERVDVYRVLHDRRVTNECERVDVYRVLYDQTVTNERREHEHVSSESVTR